MADTSNLINLDRLTTYHELITEYIDDKTAAGDGAVAEVNTLIEDTWASGKKVLAEAITEKGATVDYTATLSEMAEAIDNMKVASGNATASQVLSGATFTNSSGSQLTGTIPVVAGSTVGLGVSGSSGGSGTVSATSMGSASVGSSRCRRVFKSVESPCRISVSVLVLVWEL